MIEDTKQFVCISCPMGCMLNVSNSGNSISVTGNTCKRGEIYAINEYTNPLRTITTSIKMITKNGTQIISVKTNSEVPKNKIFDCLEEIKKIRIDEKNIKTGDVIIQNILGLESDIVATREYAIK